MALPKSMLKSLLSVSIMSLCFSLLIIADNGEFMSKLSKSLSPTPSGWSSRSSYCSWKGVTCDSFKRVTSINLASMSLNGTIPSDLNSLTVLTTLYLHYNSLSGALPSLANLSLLQTVLLDGNNFTSVPNGCFHGLLSLQTLSMSDNIHLAPWTFPTELTQSSSLVVLEFHNTNLIGSLLPDMFDSLVNLKNLRLSNNNLTGVLPGSLSGSMIQNLWLNNQKDGYGFTGSIHVLASMRHLTQVWLHNNNFTGIIPDLSNCTDLFDLQLSDNKLTGLVPTSLMALTGSSGSLLNVSLENNMLQGPFPSFGKLGLIVKVDGVNSFCLNIPGPCDPRVTTLLDVDKDFGYPLQLANSWKGNNPCDGWSFVVCSEGKIVTVKLEKQNLIGTISPAFGNLTDLRNLYLGDNHLSGSIPGILTSLQHLEVLDLSNNNLTGGEVPKFSAKVKFNFTGNVFLVGTTTSQKAKSSFMSPAWIAGASVFCATIIILIVITCKRKGYLSLLQRRTFKKAIILDHDIEDFIKRFNLSVPKRYSYAEIKRITNSFRDKLGQGGYGTVYKASLPNGCHVAMKVISESKGNGEEFINEVASISKTSHVNIVSLLGFCYEMNKRALIYEFMPNGSQWFIG